MGKALKIIIATIFLIPIFAYSNVDLNSVVSEQELEQSREEIKKKVDAVYDLEKGLRSRQEILANILDDDLMWVFQKRISEQKTPKDMLPQIDLFISTYEKIIQKNESYHFRRVNLLALKKFRIDLLIELGEREEAMKAFEQAKPLALTLGSDSKLYDYFITQNKK